MRCCDPTCSKRPSRRSAPEVPRMLRSAKRCAADPGPIVTQPKVWVPALRSSVKYAAPRPGHGALPRQKSPRSNARQVGHWPVVEIRPGLAYGAVVPRHRKHSPDIFGRLGETLAAGLIHVELAQQFFRRAQPEQFAEHDIVGVIRLNQPGIMLH